MPADRVVLWRHGRTAYNQQRRFQGQRDIALDERGRAEARAAARVLAEEVLGDDPVTVVSSDLARAVGTAVELTRLVGGEPVLDPALREVYAGEWEGLARHEIIAGWPDDFAAWTRGDDLPVGGGERRSEVAKRTAEAVRAHAESTRSGTLVVTSHGGALRGGMLVLMGMEAAAWDVLRVLGNAHWAVMHPGAGHWRLGVYNVGPRASEIDSRL